jgi:hypothetical protein
VYADNDPIKNIDFMGMNADGFTVDEFGYIERVDNTGGDEFDVVYNKENYENGNKEYDKTGSGKNGIKINKSVLDKSSTFLKSYEDESFVVDLMDASKADNSNQLFEFLADNSYVEWSKTDICLPNGKSQEIISTSHDLSTEVGALSIFKKTKELGYQLDMHTHSHPNNDDSPSPGDIKTAALYELLFNDPRFNLYLPKSGYKSYNGSSSSIIIDEVKTRPK